MTTTFTHTDADGDTLLVQQGLQSVIFTATGMDLADDDLHEVMVALHPPELAQLITTLQAMLPELG